MGRASEFFGGWGEEPGRSEKTRALGHCKLFKACLVDEVPSSAIGKVNRLQLETPTFDRF